MIVLGIIVGIILLLVAMIGVGGSIQDKNRRAKCKNWKVGDKLALNKGRHNDILENKRKEYAILKGWDLEHLYIDCGDDMVYQVNWSVMNFNKSYTWRKNYENAKKVMGCDWHCDHGEMELYGFKINKSSQTEIDEYLEGIKTKERKKKEAEIKLLEDKVKNLKKSLEN